MNYKLTILKILTIYLFFISCQNKNEMSDVFPGSNLGIKSTEDIYFNEISSITDVLFNNTNKLILGKLENIDSRILLRFNTPDEKIIVSDDSLFITLTIMSITNNYNNGLILKCAPLSKEFSKTDSLKYNDYYNSFDIEDLIEVKTYPSESDTLKIELKKNIVQKWFDNDDQNFGLIIFSDEINDSFIEFYSLSSNYRPTLNVKSIPDSLERKFSASTNCFIHNMAENKNKEDLIFSNIYPTHILTKFDLKPDYFDANDINDLKNINIVQAVIELTVLETDILTTMEKNTENRFMFKPLNLYSSFDEKSLDSKYYLEFLYFGYKDITIQHTEKDSLVRLNVTKQLQKIVTNVDSNNGILLMNNYRNRDFSFLKFYDNDNEEKKPKLKIIYSKLKE